MFIDRQPIKLAMLGCTQEEIGKAVNLTQQAVALILQELPKWEKLVKDMLERDDGLDSG